MKGVVRAVTHRHTVLLVYASFLACLLAAGWLTARSFNSSLERQVASCERGNVIRRQVNEQSRNLRLQRDILDEFLRGARRARLASGDIEVALKYALLRGQLDNVEYRRLPLVDCREQLERVK